jgi:hypothetical protein
MQTGAVNKRIDESGKVNETNWEHGKVNESGNVNVVYGKVNDSGKVNDNGKARPEAGKERNGQNERLWQPSETVKLRNEKRQAERI